jgi:hypothetical protein
MKTKEQLVEDYIEYLYGEEKDEAMYVPEVTQSRLDFSRGFEAAKEMYSPKWISVEDKLPKNDRMVVVYADNLETPNWSCKKLGSYLNNKWYCDGGRENHEIVVKWLEIPQ